MHVIAPAVKMRKTGHVKLVISAVHSKMYVTKDLHVGLQSLNVANPQSAVLCEEHRWTTIFAIVQIVRTWSWPSAKRHINTQIYSFVHTCTKLITVLKFFSMLPLLASCSASLFWFHWQDEEFWDCSNCTCPTICGIGAVPCGTPEDRLLDTPIQCPGSVDPVTWKCLKVHKLKVDRRNMPMFIDFLTVDVARF